MIELDLEVLQTVMIQQLEVIAAVRTMLQKHGLEFVWTGDWERQIAGMLKQVREVSEKKGTILKIV